MSKLKSKQLTYPLSGSFTGSLFGTSSYAITASYAMNGGGGGSTNPGGLNTQIQYNNNSNFGGVPVLTYDGTTLVGTGSFSGSFTGLTDSASYAATASYAPNYLLLTETGSITVLSSSYATFAVSGGNQNLESVLSNGNTATNDIILYRVGDIEHAIHLSTIGNFPNLELKATGSSGNGGTFTPIVGLGTDGQGGYLYSRSEPNGALTLLRFLSSNTLRNVYVQDKDGTLALLSDLVSFATTGSNTFSGSQIINGNLTVNGTASIDYLYTIYETASVIYSSGSNQFGDAANDTQTLYGYVVIPTGSLTLTGSMYTSGSNTLVGNTSLTGSLNITGSTTQIGNNTLLGNTTLSGSIIISGSTAEPTVQVYGNVTHNGYIRFDPVTTNIDTSISASYIYVSGSTKDLYFSQNGNGFNNVTRLRWLEGNLYTGLLNGGLITTQSNTIFQVGSGSGIVVNLNASQNDNPYPTIQYVNWGNLTKSIDQYSASYDQSFVAISGSGEIFVQPTPYDDGQYNTLIPIGNVIHQNRSSINATATYPSVAYGWKQRSSDFIRAFGPLKLSGLDVAVSGSSTGSLIITSGTAFSDGRNYTSDANNPSYLTDNGTQISKIFRYYQSGSNGWGYLTNGGAGFGAIDSTQYSVTGSGNLQPVPGDGVGNYQWTIQRVYWFPGGATKGIYVYYGNKTYTSKEQAIANINIESFTEAPNTRAGAVLSGYLIVRKDATFLNTDTYQIIPSGLFRNVGGSGGGGSVVTQTLSGLSDVAISGQTNGQPLVYNSTTLKWENSSTLTANLNGTATNAQTASYVETAQTASYVLQAVSSSYSLSSSYALSSSYSVSSSFATTASYITSSNVYGPHGADSVISASFAVTSSYVTGSIFTSTNPALSSSYALTASYALTSAGGGSGAGFPFTGSAVITGSLIVTGSATFTDSVVIDSTLVTSSIITTTGASPETVFTQATGSYRSMFVKYVVSETTNARAGEFMAVWNDVSIKYTDTSTTDIGDTSTVEFTGVISGDNVLLQTSPGVAGWVIKTQTIFV